MERDKALEAKMTEKEKQKFKEQLVEDAKKLLIVRKFTSSSRISLNCTNYASRCCKHGSI